MNNGNMDSDLISIEIRRTKQSETSQLNNDNFSRKSIIEKLESWRNKKKASEFPYDTIICAYHNVGKHFVDDYLLCELVNLRSELILNSKEFSTILLFLNVILDKRDDDYDYRSYTALSMLRLPRLDYKLADSSESSKRIDKAITLLMADVLRFEIEGLNGTSWLPNMPTNEHLATERFTLALKALSPYLKRLDLEYVLSPNEPLMSSKALIKAISARCSGEETFLLKTSIFPVYTAHDEYMFIRVLQCFETIFSWIAIELVAAIEKLSQNSKRALVHINNAIRYVDEAVSLFPFLSTLRKEAFMEFRKYTEGASAIQSRSYKHVESLCRRPDKERLDSLAYSSVPEIRENLLKGKVTLDDAFELAIANNSIDSKSLRKIRLSMESFEQRLIRWRQSHYAIAIKMLGDQKGTGDSKGTAYLKDVRKIPVFKAVRISDE